MPTKNDKLPPPFERIAIVGFGLIGASIALAARRAWPSALLIAVDRKDVIETAMRMHAADVGGDDLVMTAGADLVVLSAPVRANIEMLGELPRHIPGEATVTDVGSTKRETLAAAAALPGRFRFVGGHPLAGAAVGGLESARPDLFAGRPWLLTGSNTALTEFVEGLGARPQIVTADEHDSLVAYLSHLPQLAASALMHVVGERAGARGLALAGYCELRQDGEGAVEVAYFGLLKHFQGRGLGGHFLTQMVRRAWDSNPNRVWLHTSTFDHRAALPNYLKRGFRVYKTEQYLVRA